MKGKAKDTNGRYVRSYSDGDLLAIVRQVAAIADPDNPRDVSQRTYNRARDKAGMAGTLRAWRIAERLSTSWPEVLRLAFDHSAPERAIGVRQRRQVRMELTRAEIITYLDLVARHLGTETLSLGSYDQGRRELIEADRRRYVHGGQGARLIPSGQMIVSKAGSWREALDWAGLRAPNGTSGPQPYPAERALDDFISDFGYQPSATLLLTYQRQRGLATGGMPSGSDYRAWREEQMKSGIASRHGEVPIKSAGKSRKLDPAKISPAPDGFAPVGQKQVTMERAKRDIAKALEIVGSENLTQRRYGHLAVQHGLASVAAIQRVGKQAGGITWGQIRDQVIAERRTRG